MRRVGHSPLLPSFPVHTDMYDKNNESGANPAFSKIQVQAFLEVLPTAAFFVDAEGETRYANPAAAELLHMNPSELSGHRYDQPPVRVSQPDGSELDYALSPVPRALNGERVTAFEVSWRICQPGRCRACCASMPLRFELRTASCWVPWSR